MSSKRRSRVRRVLFVGSAIVCAPALLVAACSFPEVAFIADTNVPDGHVDPPSEEEEGDGKPDAVDSDAAPGDSVEAGSRQDGQARLEPDADCVGEDPCDCDDDGHLSMLCDGGDCDDRDPVVYPGQNFIGDPPIHPNVGDWDCSGTVEKQYTINLNCPALLGLGCPSTSTGFQVDPACGETVDYYRCEGGGLLRCNAVKNGTRTQGCK